MKNFSLLIKPASYRCNLRCSYCFYLCKEQFFSEGRMMSGEILEKLVSSFLAVEMPQHSFCWQGGEPTLTGLEFFRKVTFLQEKYGKPGQLVSNALQTNGILLDDDWCRHLAKYAFLVGISIDGPAEIHDRHRVSAKGEPSHGLVMRGLQSLKRNNVEYNVLTLVSDSNADKPLVVYDYLKGLGVRYHQYIECVEFGANGELTPYSVKSPQWGEFLCRIFDEWYEKDRHDVSIRLFDSILAMMVENRPNACSMSKNCCQYFVVEHNGDVYPCDFFVVPEFRLGSIMDREWKDFLRSPIYRSFGERKKKWNEKCKKCPYLSYCAGACPKTRPGQGGEEGALGALCEGWEMFFQHALPRLKLIAGQIRKEREMALERERAGRVEMTGRKQVPSEIGRNDPCRCGSGRKYKKCCGK